MLLPLKEGLGLRGPLLINLNLVDEMGFEPTTSSLRTRKNLR
jgi:hypothetical protein